MVAVDGAPGGSDQEVVRTVALDVAEGYGVEAKRVAGDAGRVRAD
jgi:hypothetical protein